MSNRRVAPRGILFVISAPSGTGKSTLCRELIKAIPDLFYSISLTTRIPRDGEKDGVDYHFVSREKFQQIVQENGFLECAEVFGNLYGTSKAHVEKALSSGKDVLMDVDVQGAMKIAHHENVVFIFLLPPSIRVLEERLLRRKTDNETQIRERVANARHEIGHVGKYDYAICNEELAESVQLLKSIIWAERCKASRNQGHLEKLGFEV